MWISILNYQLSQIEVVDISEFIADNYIPNDYLDDNEKAKDWLRTNGYNLDEISFLLTDNRPICLINNTEII